MRKGILLGLALVLMVLGTAVDSRAQGGPVLEKIWAPATVNIGTVLKIYIKATDPEGDMRWVIVSATRGTGQATGAVPIRLSKEMRKDLNGYVYFDTRGAMPGAAGTIFVQIEDWKGNETETKSLPVKLETKGAKVEKPPADFKEVAIGPVMMQNIQRPY